MTYGVHKFEILPTGALDVSEITIVLEMSVYIRLRALKNTPVHVIGANRIGGYN